MNHNALVSIIYIILYRSIVLKAQTTQGNNKGKTPIFHRRGNI